MSLIVVKLLLPTIAPTPPLLPRKRPRIYMNVTSRPGHGWGSGPLDRPPLHGHAAPRLQPLVRSIGES